MGTGTGTAMGMGMVTAVVMADGIVVHTCSLALHVSRGCTGNLANSPEHELAKAVRIKSEDVNTVPEEDDVLTITAMEM